MGRDLQRGQHLARDDCYDPYSTVQFRIAASGVTGWSVLIGHSM